MLLAAAAALQAAAQALQAQTSQNPLTQPHDPPSRTNNAHNLCPGSGVTLGSLVRDFLISRARANRSDRYLRQLRSSLAFWVQGRSSLDAASITTETIESWIDARGGATRTQRGYLMDLRTLFEWSVRRQILARNPAKDAELPQGAPEREIGIHSPDEVKRVLATAYRINPDVGRHLAVRYFAGLRSAEAHRIRESALLLDNGLVEISATQSKTRSRRLVTIQPALRAWLDLGGSLVAMSPNRVKAAIAAAGVAWPHNVTRHSFVSYHLAEFQNAGKTANEAGHSEAMLYRHYRALVTPAAAKAFWELRP